MNDRFAKRRDGLRKLLRKNKVPSLLVQKETNVSWLTGFTGEDSLLFVTHDREILITDLRFVTQLADECPDIELRVRKTRKKIETMDETVASVLKLLGLNQCGVEADQMTVGFKERIDEKTKTLEWINTRGVVEELRAIKDKFEIDEIRLAVKYAEEGFAKTCRSLQPDQTEKKVSDALEMHIRNQGGKGTSFVPIVTVGPRAALPHGRASLAKIGSHGLLLIDWGATASQYHSDLTRVLITGKISPKLERIYQVVLKAQIAAIKAIRPGAATGDVDHIARKIITDAGFGKYYGHGLGHGIGMNVHELPRIAPAVKQELQPGMVVTVEPGIYLPGIGGVRIEDDVLVTKSGYEVLSSLPKTLEESRISWAAE